MSIIDSRWYELSKTVGKSGNTAAAELTMGYKLFGITTQKLPVSMRLNCDKDGNLS